MKTSGDKPPTTRNPSHDIVVIGGSSGALDPMIQLVSALPEGYRGSLFIVSHIGANPSHLPELLSHAGWLRAAHARHGEPVEPGRIYVAPPDRHMILADHQVLLSTLPREHFTRPAVDPLFRSAARTFRARVVGIVLSGLGGDGALGLCDIQRAGGITVVQAPADAAAPEMPEAALRAVRPDHMVEAAAVAALIPYLDVRPASPKVTGGAEIPVSRDEDMTTPAALTCPECGGAVREVPGAGLLSYQCHTGHRFSADELLLHQRGDVERAIMVAIRVLQERAALCRRMGADAQQAGRQQGVAYWHRLTGEAEDQLEALRPFLQPLVGEPAAVRKTAEPVK